MKNNKAYEHSKFPRVMHLLLCLGAGGGAENLVCEMARYEFNRQNPPVVCALHTIGQLGERLLQEGIQVYSRPLYKGVDLGIINWLSRIIKEERIGLIHAHTYTPVFYAVPAAILAGGIKVVYTEHGRLYPDRRRLKRYLLNPFLAMGIDHLVSISESTKKNMARYDNFPTKRIRVIHNGVNFPTMRPEVDIAAKRRSLGLDENSRIIGTAARLEEIKNIPMLLRAFKRVAEKMPGTCLLIAGTGSKELELKMLAESLGIARRVVFLGLRNDLPEIYRLFEIFLLTSHTEGISLTLLEAMSSGLPGIVTNVGGNPEVVVDGVTGWLVPPGDDAAMAEKVLMLLDNPFLASLVGDNGRKRIAEHFSFDRMMSSYQAIYKA